MSAMHTPGQWRAIHWTRHAATTVVVDDPSVITGKRVIADCATEEDARLIAAAPEMLDALRRLEKAISSAPHDAERPNALEQAIAAITKATGVAK